MNALTAWLEKYILPIATKMGSQKHLVALRDAFIGTMPATMAGSIAVMINAIIRDLPAQFIEGYDGASIPVIREIIAVNGFVWNGTIAIAGLVFAFSWGYNLAKAYNVNNLAGGIVSLAALIQGISFGPSETADLGMKVPANIATAITDSGIGATVTPGGELSVGLWGWLNLNHLNGNAFFTAMIIGAVSVIIFAKLMQKNITIKLPESVPPAVSNAFAAIIPATAALYIIAIFNFAFGEMTGMLFIDWVQETIAKPLMGFSQGLGAVLVIQLAIQIFWFFGIHGTNVMAPVLEGIFGQAQLINIDVFQKGYDGLTGTKAVLAAIEDGKAYMWVRGSFDAYSMFGGSGGTITLILAILIFSKRADYLTMGKLALGPGIFNINEPIMFGLPIVLNAIMFIPFIVAPVVATAIGYLATSWGLVAPVSQAVTWVVPPVLLSFLATGADWRAPLVTIVCMLVTFAIWAPFVIAANKMDPSLEENN
ncbi:PTS sugar transporter subunit IIC [Vagococcus intermedius]|uniref:Permease IIC component n=1 Tax=Vagococcus intermedius TaxID=2991418 RepID=A0AAF0I8B5_9ENTE|nr:PTS transporter subunit EIIC [Vagococcus intermedius]WEG73771.1 PTS transporter subunit EIIC [Vagococcus intermedius]WEG75856.1 PTS transporter subunit EIIC [Vagococcus intermedius]